MSPFDRWFEDDPTPLGMVARKEATIVYGKDYGWDDDRLVRHNDGRLFRAIRTMRVEGGIYRHSETWEQVEEKR